MHRRSLFVLIGVIVAVLIAAFLLGFVLENGSKRSVHASSTCLHDKELRTYDQWRQSVTFPYIAPEGRLERVKDNYSRVEIGSSKEEVLKAFGPPDFEEEMYPKEPNRPCLGYEFMYYFEKPEETVNGFKDKRIEVFFTRGGTVKWLVGNVGLAEKGGYANRP